MLFRSANDDRIIEYFRSVASGKRPTTGGVVNIDIDVPDGAALDAETFVNSIELQCWSRLAKLSWRPFEEARAFVNGLQLTGQSEWREYCKGRLPSKGMLPKDLPASPNQVYKDRGWFSWGDWLGTGTIAPRLIQYRTFLQAREFARSLDLKGVDEWFKFCHGEYKDKGGLPPDIPTTPYNTYRNEGWISFGDWLGTGSIATFLRQYRPFHEARDYVRRLELKNAHQWNMYIKGQLPSKGSLPKDIPMNPRKVYEDEGWINLGEIGRAHV